MIDLCPCRCYIRSLFIFCVLSLPYPSLSVQIILSSDYCTNSFFSAQVNLFICPSTPNLALLPCMRLPAAAWVPSEGLDRVQVQSPSLAHISLGGAQEAVVDYSEGPGHWGSQETWSTWNFFHDLLICLSVCLSW